MNASLDDLYAIIGVLLREIHSLRADGPVVSEIRALRAVLERITEDGGASTIDGAELVKAIAHVAPDRVFVSAELAQLAAALPSEALADLLAAAGATTPRKIGKLLRKLEHDDTGPYQIVRVGAARDGAIWSVSAASLGPSKLANSHTPLPGESD
jgi:hypothetical protein